MEIFLMRHPKPDVDKNVCYGQADLKLLTGWQTAIRESLKGLENIDLIVSSPLVRCAEVATWVHNNIFPDADYQENEAWKELNFGEWELMQWNDIPQKDLDLWMQDYENVSPPQGETLKEMRNRVLGAWGKLLTVKNKKVLVIAHAGAIRIVLAHHFKISYQEALKISINYGEYKSVLING